MNTKKTLLALTLSTMIAAPAFANTWKGEAKDAWLDGKVETALMMNGQINNFEIDTNVENSVVYLSGEVDNNTEKKLAGKLAANVDGITDVNNKIVVMKPQGETWEGQARDAWIDGRVETALMFDTDINSFAIDTDVREGAVTLTGKVDSDAKKKLAGRIAADIDGVRSVTNNISVEKDYQASQATEGGKFARKMQDIAVTAGLNIEYAAQSELEATAIDVDTNQGVVTLTGKVDNETAKSLAVEIARGYEGVTSVEDNLNVTK